MNLCYMFNDGKAESGASCGFASAFVHTEKAFKYMLLIFFLNPYAGVLYRKYAVVFIGGDFYNYFSVFLIISYSVVAKIVDKLLKQRWVCSDKCAFTLKGDFNPFCFGIY